MTDRPPRRARTPRRHLYRIGRPPDPLVWPPHAVTGQERFDDPLRQYRVLYAATPRAGCFAETLAAFRPSLASLAAERGVLHTAEPSRSAYVPAAWWRDRLVGTFTLGAGRWLDLFVPCRSASPSQGGSSMTCALPDATYAANDDDRHRHGLVVIHSADDPNDADTPRPVQLRADWAAQHLGVQAADIERLPFDLSALEGEGAFINVDARNFGLLDRRLDWRALGVTLPGRGDLAFRPPRCGLVPDRYRLVVGRDRQHARNTDDHQHCQGDQQQQDSTRSLERQSRHRISSKPSEC